MNQELISSSNTKDFFKTLATYQSPAEKPKPIYVTLDGKTGTWEEKQWKEAEKKSEKVPWKNGGVWGGAILMVKWFAKDKYKEGATVVRRTREFSDWDDKIEYLEVDYAKQGPEATKVLATYNGYKAFKEARNLAYGAAVKEAVDANAKIPPQADYLSDLWASLYVFDFETERIVNVKLKGMGRKAVFDYLKDWRRGMEEADSISQVLTQFDSVKFTEPQVYYGAKLRAECVLSEPHQEKVKEAVLALMSWMKSFEPEEEVKVEATVEADPQEIRLEEIPF